jgi:uncharacterized protein DUF5916
VTDSTNGGNSVVIFGKRNISTITNTLNTDYILNNKASFSFRLRHYWLRARYNEFYDLEKSGGLSPNAYHENHNFTFNAFNIDLVFVWNFAPGSEVLVVWKNAVYTDKDEVSNDFFKNIRNTLDSPASNSFSVKFMYYLDYQYLKRKASKN